MERSSTSAEGPDVLRWILVGDLQVADVERLFAEQLVFCEGKSSIYIIIDMTRLGNVSSEARRAAARAPAVNGQLMPVKAVGIVGGSFQLRMLGKMINTASALLHRMNATPIDFFDTTQQARDWLETLKLANERKEAAARQGRGL
jgi:hypothetical protein